MNVLSDSHRYACTVSTTGIYQLDQKQAKDKKKKKKSLLKPVHLTVWGKREQYQMSYIQIELMLQILFLKNSYEQMVSLSVSL